MHVHISDCRSIETYFIRQLNIKTKILRWQIRMSGSDLFFEMHEQHEKLLSLTAANLVVSALLCFGAGIGLASYYFTRRK